MNAHDVRSSVSKWSMSQLYLLLSCSFIVRSFCVYAGTYRAEVSLEANSLFFGMEVSFACL